MYTYIRIAFEKDIHPMEEVAGVGVIIFLLIIFYIKYMYLTLNVYKFHFGGLERRQLEN